MRELIFIFLIIGGTRAHADLAKKLNCQASTSIALNVSSKDRKLIKGGSFVVSEKDSQTITIMSDKKKKIAKIFPWYGFDMKTFGKTTVVNKSIESRSFSLKFKEPNSKKVYSLACSKI